MCPYIPLQLKQLSCHLLMCCQHHFICPRSCCLQVGLERMGKKWQQMQSRRGLQAMTQEVQGRAKRRQDGEVQRGQLNRKDRKHQSLLIVHTYVLADKYQVLRTVKLELLPWLYGFLYDGTHVELQLQNWKVRNAELINKKKKHNYGTPWNAFAGLSLKLLLGEKPSRENSSTLRIHNSLPHSNGTGEEKRNSKGKKNL